MSQKHILFVGVPAWGHVRAFCILAARLVNDDEKLVVTMLISPTLLDKTHSEVSTEIRDASALRRIRIVSTIQWSPELSTDMVGFQGKQVAAYPAAYQALSEGKSITCPEKMTTFDAVPAPAMVVIDFLAYAHLQATRAITGHSVPIMAWLTGHASSHIRYFGPESLGGIGDFGARLNAEATRTGLAPEEFADKLFEHTEGKVINIPGLPPMFDHELFPQKLSIKFPIAMAIKDGYLFLQECDVVITTAAYAFENEALDAIKSWFSDLKKPIYFIGPLLPLGYGTTVQSPRGAIDIQDFLDKTLLRHGRNSLLFISFGTLFWPTAEGYIDEVIEALIENKFPFIFCFASSFAHISDELAATVKASGLGLMLPWVPQQFILNHPATGWFLTHCGHSSVTESLAAGIPMITWPFEGDQPGGAAYLTQNLGVAFDLIEVRTGENGLKPLHRNGRVAKGTREAVGVEFREVIKACRSHEGERLRNQAQDLKVRIQEAWKEGGASRKELNALLAKYA